VSWKSPGNLLGWICRRPVMPYCLSICSAWLIQSTEGC